MQETRPDRSHSIQPSDMYTVGVRQVCHDIGRHVNCGSLFRLTCKVNGHCHTVYEQMSAATKHAADDTVFQQDVFCVLVCKITQYSKKCNFRV